jgi:hypothetical protein
MADTVSQEKSGKFIPALHESINRCRKISEPALIKQQEILAEYANGWYTKDARIRRPLNMVARAINLLIPLLCSRNPKAMVRPRVVQLTPYAETLRLTLNHLIQKIRLSDTLRETVLNSLTYMGVLKTGITSGGPKYTDELGYLHDNGQIFCDTIYPEDYFFDTTARKREEMDFEGNWFYVPLEFITDSGLYKNYDKLSDAYTNWDKYAAKKVAEDSRNLKVDTFKPYVKLGEVWLPGENVLITIPAEGQGDKPLRVVEYNGPISGPYDTLSFCTFPESILPIAPLFNNLDLHYLINIMARKMARQANREKKVLAYQGNSAEDAERVVNAVDGASVKVDDINAIKEVEYGGTADASYQYIAWLMQGWSQQGANMNLMGGQSADSPTLGQDQMLMANASTVVDDMVAAVYELAQKVLFKMAFYVFTDPLMDITVSKRVGGLEDIPVHVTADSREGDFWSYNFDVEPYSMQRMNPNVRMRKMMELTTGLIIPTAQMSAMQGATLKVPNLVKSIARDMDMTDGEIDNFYDTGQVNSNTGPYPQNPQKFPTQPNDMNGASEASQELNLMQQQNANAEKPSPPNTNNI